LRKRHLRFRDGTFGDWSFGDETVQDGILRDYFAVLHSNPHIFSFKFFQEVKVPYAHKKLLIQYE
jgi:hypothetical protein